MSLKTSEILPFDYIVFGATGDLTMRKLLPALYYRFKVGQIPDNAHIIGSARSALSREAYVSRAREALKRHVGNHEFDPDVAENFLSLLHYVSLDGSKPDGDWQALETLLHPASDHHPRVFYFATAPNLFGNIAENLHLKGLIHDQSRVVLEKPIGTDLTSAIQINAAVGRFFRENQIYRIDHYVGKEAVQGIPALRFSNPVIEAAWSCDFIESVQITAAEIVGVEGRAAYYNQSGAMRDMIQNHLLQVLSLVAMELPSSLEADAVRDAKVAALRALVPLDSREVGEQTVRAQYSAGTVKKAEVPGYLEELGAPSATETYVAICAFINTPRWNGVPFFLRTAKRLKCKVSEVVITFKPSQNAHYAPQYGKNVLSLRLQPNEGLSWRLNIKDPLHDDESLCSVDMGVDIAKQRHVRFPDAYERLQLDAIRGNPALFIRRDEVESAWRWVEPILAAWSENIPPMTQYPAGSWGPDEASEMISRFGAQWREDMACP